MSKTYSIILILGLGLIFQGCAVLEYLDGSSKEELGKFQKTKDSTPNNTEQSKIENINLQKQIDILRKENQKIRDDRLYEMARMREQNELLNEQLVKIKEQNQRIRDEKSALITKISEVQPKQEAYSPASRELEKDIRKLKIKVLSGDGDLKSAKEISKKLRDMGYRITIIDSAPRSNFVRNTIYFASTFQTEAKRLASSLGTKTILKPLKWSSVFNLIVVTGKNP